MLKEKHSLSPYHLQQGSSQNGKIATIANKFAAKPSRALPWHHSSSLARAGSSRSLSSQNVSKSSLGSQSCSSSSLGSQKFRQLLILFSRFPKSTNVQKFPQVSIHKRRKVPSVLNPALQTFTQFSIRFSKSSLSSQSCSPGSLGPQTFSKSSLSSQSGSPSSLKVHSFTLILNPVLQVQKRFSESSRSSVLHIRSPYSHFVPKSVSLSAAGEHEALDQMAPRDRVGSGCIVLVGWEVAGVYNWEGVAGYFLG